MPSAGVVGVVGIEVKTASLSGRTWHALWQLPAIASRGSFSLQSAPSPQKLPPRGAGGPMNSSPPRSMRAWSWARRDALPERSNAR